MLFAWPSGFEGSQSQDLTASPSSTLSAAAEFSVVKNAGTLREPPAQVDSHGDSDADLARLLRVLLDLTNDQRAKVLRFALELDQTSSGEGS